MDGEKLEERQPEIARKGSIRLDMEPGTYYWCACGRSQGQPFCDGSHQGSGFAPLKYVIGEKKSVSWCGCKRSAQKPLCDGTHKRL